MNRRIAIIFSVFTLTITPTLADDAAVIAKMDALTARITELESKLALKNAQPLNFDLIPFQFSDIREWAEITDSKGALFCALTKVNDNTVNGSCEIRRDSNNNWVARTGDNAFGNGCEVTCLRPK